MEFVLTLKMGNDGMQDEHDVARALRIEAEKIECFGLDHGPGRIRDINGNTVGEWAVVDGG